MASFDESKPLPKVVVFDLDYTLWCWCDTHVSRPFKPDPKAPGKTIVDRYGTRMSFFPEVPEVLAWIRNQEDMDAVSASRTHDPETAKTMLSMFSIGNEPSTRFLVHKTWGIGTKRKHFKEIQKLTGVAYEDMVFFDDESRNKEVETLGVTFVLVTEEEGVSWRSFNRGLKLWQLRNSRH